MGDDGAGDSVGKDVGKDRIVWVDCEMTGLDLGADALVEVAALVTDSDLRVLGAGVDVVVKPSKEALDQMVPFVRDMHTTSGLLPELEHGTTLSDAEEQVLAYIREWVPEARKAPLAGSSVGTDRMFLARDMPALDAHLHYRVVDVSSIKEMVKRWYPRVHYSAPAKHGGHRAMADIIESIAELRFYREAVFVPQPGPDSAATKVIAARHVVPAGTMPAWAASVPPTLGTANVADSSVSRATSTTA